MKKVILSMAVVAAMFVSCKQENSTGESSVTNNEEKVDYEVQSNDVSSETSTKTKNAPGSYKITIDGNVAFEGTASLMGEGGFEGGAYNTEYRDNEAISFSIIDEDFMFGVRLPADLKKGSQTINAQDGFTVTIGNKNVLYSGMMSNAELTNVKQVNRNGKVYATFKMTGEASLIDLKKGYNSGEHKVMIEAEFKK